MSDLPPLIRSLLAPARYPHAVERVELLQTHLSWVLLAGEYAYKIKKPVQFDFVDFSTLERRRTACEDELMLNRRFAPSLYVDVTPISGLPEAPVFARDDSPIEYAVRMRRFDQGCLLAALIEEHSVQPEQLAAFGAQLAAIHETAPRCGGAEAARQTFCTIHDNAREFSGVAGAPPIDDLIEWLEREWGRVSSVAAARAVEGRMRECHGDLHTGNIVQQGHELMAFDCIEFSERLRCIDVTNDAAFLFMDLLARNARSLAYAFLNSWLERNGDYGGVALLPLFALYRALVRAKVMRLGDDAAASDRYVRLARRTAGRGSPLLIVMCGLSGSGKTWMSNQILVQTGGVRVRSDVERKRLAGLRAHDSSRSLELDIYTLAMNAKVYDLLLRHARTLLESSECAIIDAAFLKESERTAFLALARALHAPALIVHCLAAEPELHRRLDERERSGRDASEATSAVLELQRAAFEAFTANERPHVLTVDTSRPESVASTLREIAERAAIA